MIDVNSILPKAKLTDVGLRAESKPGKPGRVPWSVTFKGNAQTGEHAIIVDADRNVLFDGVRPALAGRIVGAVNMVECAHKPKPEAEQ